MKNILKYLFTLFFILCVNATLWACPACEKQQPKFTQGLTHGAGPDSNWDWVIIALISIITILTFFYSLKYLVKPGEKNIDHIKQSILNS